MGLRVSLQFGFDGDYGLRCFKRVLEYYKNDPPLTYQFMYFCQMCVRRAWRRRRSCTKEGLTGPTGCRESMACDEAELGPEGMQKKMEAMRVKQQEEVIKMRAEMKQHLESLSPEQVGPPRPGRAVCSGDPRACRSAPPFLQVCVGNARPAQGHDHRAAGAPAACRGGA